jgi:hypothetical protein
VPLTSLVQATRKFFLKFSSLFPQFLFVVVNCKMTSVENNNSVDETTPPQVGGSQTNPPSTINLGLAHPEIVNINHRNRLKFEIQANENADSSVSANAACCSIEAALDQDINEAVSASANALRAMTATYSRIIDQIQDSDTDQLSDHAKTRIKRLTGRIERFIVRISIIVRSISTVGSVSAAAVANGNGNAAPIVNEVRLQQHAGRPAVEVQNRRDENPLRGYKPQDLFPKLPELKFSGQRTDWQLFIDLFQERVTAARLDEKSAYHQLVISLPTEVQQEIAMHRSKQNPYELSLQKLDKIYGNKEANRRLIIEELHNYPAVKSDRDLDALRKLETRIETTIEQLEALDKPDDQIERIAI